MKFVKFALFIGICIAIAGTCLNARLRTQKEAEKTETKTKCAAGRVYNMYSNRCEANKNTITQGDKQLDFYNKYKNPTIVDLLPIFKYEEDKKQQKTEEKRKN